MWYSGTSISPSAKGLGQLVRDFEGTLYRKPRYNEFVGNQPKCSLYRVQLIINRSNKGQRRYMKRIRFYDSASVILYM